MLKVMVNTAYQWMMIGLPLQKLKIVVYARQLSQLGPTEQKCVQIFSEMKDIINNMKSVPRVSFCVLNLAALGFAQALNMLKSLE